VRWGRNSDRDASFTLTQCRRSRRPPRILRERSRSMPRLLAFRLDPSSPRSASLDRARSGVC
jgi:hypothetical protein